MVAGVAEECMLLLHTCALHWDHLENIDFSVCHHLETKCVPKRLVC